MTKKPFHFSANADSFNMSCACHVPSILTVFALSGFGLMCTVHLFTDMYYLGGFKRVASLISNNLDRFTS